MRVSLFSVEYEHPGPESDIRAAVVALRCDCGADADAPPANPWAEARYVINRYENVPVEVLEVRQQGTALVDERLLSGGITGANGT